MNKLRGIIFALLLVISAAASGQEKDKDVMIKRIFAVLKNGDEDGYVKLFPDAAVTKEFILGMFKKDTSKEASAEMLNAFFEKLTDEELEQAYRREFKRTIKLASSNGIDLSKSTLVSYSADSATKEDESLKASMLSGKIYFTVGDSACFMSYRDIIWFENKGWYGIHIYRIDRKSLENEPDPILEEEYIDSVNIATVDTMVAEPPPPPPPPKKVKPASAPVKPVKGKSTTAARKPDH